MYHETEKTFEQQVVDCLKGTRSIHEVVSFVCKMSDGKFALQVNGDDCILYSRSSGDESKILGHELITYASVAINEIERLNELGVVSVFQANARNLITIGDLSLVGNSSNAFTSVQRKFLNN